MMRLLQLLCGYFAKPNMLLRFVSVANKVTKFKVTGWLVVCLANKKVLSRPLAAWNLRTISDSRRGCGKRGRGVIAPLLNNIKK